MKAIEKAKELVKFLNEAFKIDPKSVEMLFSFRVPCNKEMLDHPTVQVGTLGNSDFYVYGIIGLLNGFCGANRNGWGYVGIDYDGDKMKGFKIVNIEEEK